MKPLGQRPNRRPGKVDHHPGKGWINWWEAEGYGSNNENKAREKREWQHQAKKELDDDQSDNSPAE